MKISGSLLFVLVIIAISHPCFGQTANDNYVKSYKALEARDGDLSTVNDKSKVAVSIEYYDGLGRPLQSIQKQGSRGGYDLVTFWVYDAYGRKTKTYLPYASTATDGNVKSNPVTEQSSFYQNLPGVMDGQNTFSLQVVEDSDLARVIKVGSPGAPWQPDTSDPYSINDKTVKKKTELNVSNEVMLFAYDAGTGLVSRASGAAGFYQANVLNVNRTLDEHNNEVAEFSDNEGRVICKKVQYGVLSSVKQFASTYYIYDVMGNLVMVLPPEAAKNFENQ